MPTISHQLLSGSTNGRPIKIAATATAGTLVHAAVSGTRSIDKVFLYLNNTSGASVVATVEFGGATSPDDLIKVDLAAEAGPVLVVPGLPLNNSLEVRVFAASPNVINATGIVHRVV